MSRVERQGDTASAALAPHASSTWTLGDGNYEYDGSGNVKAIGSSVFIYDVENRLVSEGTAGTTATRQKYTYDGFGNILTYKDDDGLTYTVGADAATNRASVASSSALHMSGTYDHSGNMTGRSDDLFRYDALNVLTKSFADGQWRAYVYNVNDERVGTILMTAETGGGETSSEWTIRDAAGQVLRRFAKQGGQYVWQQDYIYRDGKMLASEVTGQVGTLHYHLDHLGSPRLITGNGGVEISRHTYYPFGKEAVTGQPVREDKKFTGHERDPIGLDYMHARFYDYRMGRFLSVDPVMDIKEAVHEPQLWNRYSYVTNNPLKFTDPDGRYRTFYKEKPMTAENLAMDENTPAVVRYSMYVTGGLTALGAGGFFFAGASGGYASYGLLVRTAPAVSSPALQKVVDSLFKATDRLPGGTAGALRNEIATGVATAGRFHLQAGLERLGSLQKLIAGGTLSSRDLTSATRMTRDLQQALQPVLTRLNMTAAQLQKELASGRLKQEDVIRSMRN